MQKLQYPRWRSHWNGSRGTKVSHRRRRCNYRGDSQRRVIPCGGTTYINLQNYSPTLQMEPTSPGTHFTRHLRSMTNSGERYGVKLEELKEYGKGSMSWAMVNLSTYAKRNHRPVMVIKQTIQNSVSVAGRVPDIWCSGGYRNGDKRWRSLIPVGYFFFLLS